MAPELVVAAVERHMSKRWEWGQADCCSSVRNVFRDLHGIDIMEPLGRYTTALGASRIVRDYGGFSEMTDTLAGMAGLKTGTGGPGEVGLSPKGAASGIEGYALLICIAPGAWAGKTELGYAILPEAVKSWSI